MPYAIASRLEVIEAAGLALSDEAQRAIEPRRREDAEWRRECSRPVPPPRMPRAGRPFIMEFDADGNLFDRHLTDEELRANFS
jgi:hypothetical protein